MGIHIKQTSSSKEVPTYNIKNMYSVNSQLSRWSGCYTRVLMFTYYQISALFIGCTCNKKKSISMRNTPGSTLLKPSLLSEHNSWWQKWSNYSEGFCGTVVSWQYPAKWNEHSHLLGASGASAHVKTTTVVVRRRQSDSEKQSFRSYLWFLKPWGLVIASLETYGRTYVEAHNQRGGGV